MRRGTAPLRAAPFSLAASERPAVEKVLSINVRSRAPALGTKECGRNTRVLPRASALITFPLPPIKLVPNEDEISAARLLGRIVALIIIAAAATRLECRLKWPRYRFLASACNVCVYGPASFASRALRNCNPSVSFPLRPPVGAASLQFQLMSFLLINAAPASCVYSNEMEIGGGSGVVLHRVSLCRRLV